MGCACGLVVSDETFVAEQVIGLQVTGGEVSPALAPFGSHQYLIAVIAKLIEVNVATVFL